ncbi:hypothetical protein [Micromonospora sp. NPDC023956]|uniref:hypothetical protein n=1 Tax=Micromonospora sp. NPDC023956 TaxID=3155722 RepID=UPI0033DE2CB7
MKPLRVLSAVLVCAALTLAGCGGADDTTAGPAPSAGPTSSATSTPSSPTTSSAPAPSTSVGGTGDKEICTSVKEIGNDMKASLVTALQADQAAAPAAFRKVLTDLEGKLTALAATGGDTAVTTAIRAFTTEAAKAAKAADPATAADNPAFEKAGTDLTAACKKAGVEVNF